jgi:hypothetical protein
MTPKKFYDWQTAGGTDDVMRMVDCLERAYLACLYGLRFSRKKSPVDRSKVK